MTVNSPYVPALGRAWLTPYYDTVVRVSTRERRVKQALIDQAGLGPGRRGLDLATGTGTLAIRMKQSRPTLAVSALDGDATILAIAAQKAVAADVEVDWLHALSSDLPFPAGHFDRVMSSLFFHHLTWDDKLRAARE